MFSNTLHNLLFCCFLISRFLSPVLYFTPSVLIIKLYCSLLLFPLLRPAANSSLKEIRVPMKRRVLSFALPCMDAVEVYCQPWRERVHAHKLCLPLSHTHTPLAVFCSFQTKYKYCQMLWSKAGKFDCKHIYLLKEIENTSCNEASAPPPKNKKQKKKNNVMLSFLCFMCLFWSSSLFLVPARIKHVIDINAQGHGGRCGPK